jgi:DNA (cytosine-5)-methyltransferase 1
MGRLKVVSLFTGCGGMDLGMKGGFEFLWRKYSKNPVELVYALDNKKEACELFESNFNLKCFATDIREIKATAIPPHHILTGGFPCRSFSRVALNPPRLGCKDENGRLYLEMCRILKERRPLCFIAENVKGILCANKRKAFPLIIQGFEDAGYHVKYSVLDSSDYGIPQRRIRVFIVGFRDREIYNHFDFPKPVTPTNKVPLSKVVIPKIEIDAKYYFSEKAVTGMKRAREEMRKGRVQDLNGLCNTVGAHLAKVSLNGTDPVLKINRKYRRFTPREVARIQSFPEEYALVGSEAAQYRALGNAVPPVLMWYITREVIKAIKKTNRKLMNSMPYRTKQEIRSYNMSRIRSHDTSIETCLCKALWYKGYRYRKNCKDVLGKPDIVFKSKKVAIFCDSSFWHGRHITQDTSRIKTNKKYWKQKIKRNVQRDKEVTSALKKAGWKVLRFWDTDLKENLAKVLKKIEKTLLK